MKVCPGCGAQIGDAARFCTECGFNIKEHEDAQREKFCPRCGTKITGGRFCPQCGVSLADGAVNGQQNPFIIQGGILIKYVGNQAQLTIPAGVTAIGDEAFSGCSSVRSITIPYGVTSIGDRAFKSCTSLARIDIPDSMRSIGQDAFIGCKSIMSITLPFMPVTSKNSFTGCPCCVIIKMQESVRYLFYFSKERSAAHFDIPNGITHVGFRAFEGCTSLASVTIPSSVTEIEEYAFVGCANLQSITLPDSVTSIKKGAFSGCTSLVVRIPAAVYKRADQEAFLDVKKLIVI